MTLSLDQVDLARALREALPPQHVGQAEALAAALVTATGGSGNVVSDPALHHAVTSLQGARVRAGAAQVDFSGMQAGDITIGDIAGGNIIHITLTLPPSALSVEERRRRYAMLAKVRTIWVDGLLARAQSEGGWVDLRLTDQPDAIELPLRTQYQELRDRPRDLPPGTRIGERFAASGESMLLLGAVGAGKTMLLLELCRDLLTRALKDESAPIPVVLNLASWSARREPLAAWVVRELQRVYDVATAIGTEWLAASSLALLLDGLDESQPEERAAQVEGINRFRQQSPCPIAVCSRWEVYEGLTARLRLGGAVKIRPLARAQVDDMLRAAGGAADSIRATLARSPQLGGAVDTPLLLRVLMRIEAEGDHLRQEPIAESDLWRAYAEAALARRRELPAAEAAAIHEGLARIAAHLQRAGEDTIRVEELSEAWLPARYRPLVSTVLPAVGLIGVAALGYFLRWMVAEGLNAPTSNLGFLQGVAPAFNALLAVAVAATAAFFAHTRIDTLGWSWTGARRFREWAALPPLLALGFATVNSNGTLPSFVLFGLIGLGASGVLSLAVILGMGLRPTVIASISPGQVLRRTAYSGALLGVGGLAFGWLSGLLGGLFIYGLFAWLGGRPLITTWENVLQSGRNGLNIGYLIGLWLGLQFGGYATIRHWAIRLSLAMSGTLPLRVVHFLDRCAERALLLEIGGGYSFTHRLLLEHYAARNETGSADGAFGDAARLPASPHDRHS